MASVAIREEKSYFVVTDEMGVSLTINEQGALGSFIKDF